MSLPLEVIEAVRRGQCLLIAGSRLTLEAAELAERAYPGQKELVKALGQKGTLQEACAAFEAQRGREALVAALRLHIGASDLPIPDFVRATVRRFPLIFSSALDDLIERACAAEGLVVQLAYRDDPVPAPASPNHRVIYKLRGDFSRPDRLVLTAADAERLSLRSRGDEVRKLLRKNEAFFIGYRPDEDEFDRAFEDFSVAFGGELPRCHLAVAQGRISDYHWQKWVWRGLLLFTADPSEVVGELERHLHG